MNVTKCQDDNLFVNSVHLPPPCPHSNPHDRFMEDPVSMRNLADENPTNMVQQLSLGDSRVDLVLRTTVNISDSPMFSKTKPIYLGKDEGTFRRGD